MNLDPKTLEERSRRIALDAANGFTKDPEFGATAAAIKAQAEICQLIRDCIAAVVPVENQQCANDILNGQGCDPKDHAWREGYNAAIDDLKRKAEEMLV